MEHKKKILDISRLVLCGAIYGGVLLGCLPPFESEAAAATMNASWTDASGNWTDPSNWSTNPSYPKNGTPTGATYDVSLPNTGSQYTVTLDASTAINGLNIDNATLSLSRLGRLTLSGNQTVNGSGTIVLEGQSEGGTLTPSNSSTLTIGPNITVRTGTNASWTFGTIGGSGGLVNNGVISCQDANAQLTITGNNWVNNGDIRLSSGILMLSGTMSTASLGTVQRTGGTLLLAGSLDNTGDILDLDSLGTLCLSYGSINGGTVFSSSASQLTTNAPASLNGVSLATDLTHTTSYNGGTVSFSNGLTLLNHNINLRAGVKLTATDASTLGGTGQVIVDGLTGATGAETIVGGDSVTIGPNITVRSGVTDPGADRLIIKTVLNQGLISAQSNMSITVTNSSQSWTNVGAMEVSVGQLALTGTWNNEGTITATGGSLMLAGTWTNNGSTTAFNTSVSLGGVGSGLSNIALTNCNLNVSGVYTTAQVREIAMLTTSLGVMASGVGVLDNTGDILTLAGPNADFRLEGGTLRGGVVQSPDSHKIVCSNRGDGSVLDGVRLEVPLVVSSAGVRAYNLDNRSTITFTKDRLSSYQPGLALYGPWSNTGSISISQGYFILYDAPTEQGSITISDSHCDVHAHLTTAQIRNMSTSKVTWRLDDGGFLDNTGDTLVLSQDGNTWVCYGGTIKGGTVQSPDGTALGISKSASHGFTSMTLDGVTLATDVRITSSAEPTITNGVVLTNNSTIYFNADYATLQFSGNQTIGGAGTIVINSHSDDYSGLESMDGVLTIGPNIVLRNDTRSCFLEGDIINQGLLSARTASKKVTVSGSFTNEGVVEVRDGGTLLFNTAPTNLSSTQLTGGSWRAFANSAIRLIGADIRTNAAEIILDGSGANVCNAASGITDALANLANNAAGGRFIIRNGRDFATVGALSNSGTIGVGAATVLYTPGGLSNTATGVLEGAGAINADIVNAGTIAPGDDAPSVGLITIQGDVVEHAGGRLQMELGGTARGSSYDALNIGGTLYCDGTLHVSLIDGFEPGMDMGFDLFDFDTAYGQFAALDLPTLPNGLSWDSSELYTTGALRVVPEPYLTLVSIGIVSLVACVRRQRPV